MLVRHRVVFHVVAIVANSCDVEKLYIIAQRNPKAPIIFVHIIHLLFDFVGPEGRIVAPVAGPFFAPPRIPNLNQPLALPIVKFYFSRSDK